jgi:hypothetical protein
MIQLSFLGFLQGDDVREMYADWIAKEMPSTVGASARDRSITRAIKSTTGVRLRTDFTGKRRLG